MLALGDNEEECTQCLLSTILVQPARFIEYGLDCHHISALALTYKR